MDLFDQEFVLSLDLDREYGEEQVFQAKMEDSLRLDVYMKKGWLDRNPGNSIVVKFAARSGLVTARGERVVLSLANEGPMQVQYDPMYERDLAVTKGAYVPVELFGQPPPKELLMFVKRLGAT